MKSTLLVRVNSPEKILWEGDAYSVSSENSQGVFDILPQHANFITIVENQPIKIDTAKEGGREYIFPRSVIYNRNNRVMVYTNM